MFIEREFTHCTVHPFITGGPLVLGIPLPQSVLAHFHHPLPKETPLSSSTLWFPPVLGNHQAHWVSGCVHSGHVI